MKVFFSCFYLPLFVLSIYVSLCGQHVYAQSASFDYYTKEEKKALTKYFYNNYTLQKKNSGRYSSRRIDLAEAYRLKYEWLVSQIEHDEFVKNKQIAETIATTYAHLKANYPAGAWAKKILISKSMVPNAYCTGEGTIILNLGILERLHSVSELAFVLAHEAAHNILDHVNENINRHYDKDLSNKKKDRMHESSHSADRLLTTYQSIIYEDFHHSVKLEEQADSLGLQIIKKSNFQVKAYQQVLSMLDSSDYPVYKVKPNIKECFNFPAYPFQEKWLKKSATIFDEERKSVFIFEKDSLKTHPNCFQRIAYLNTLSSYVNDSQRENQSLDHITKLITENAISITQKSNDYGRGLFLALQAIEKTPNDTYSKLQLSQLLVNIYEAKKDHSLGKYIKPSYEYPKLMEDIYAFLTNIRLSELGKLSFHYINNENNFDPKIEDFYVVLWKMSTYVNDKQVMQEVRKAYTQNFPKGKYKTTFITD